MAVGTGKYRARAVDAWLAETPKSKTSQVAVDLEVMEGPCEGDHIIWYGFLTEKTIDRTTESLRILGWKGDDLTDLSSVRGEAQIDVGEEEYQGRLRTRVNWINRLRSDGENSSQGRLSLSDAKALADKLKQRVRTADAARAAAAREGAPSSSGAPSKPPF